MIVTVVFIHHRVMLGKKQRVAAHRISEALERSEVANVLVIGLEQCRDAVLAHQPLRPLDALAAHTIRVESFLPICSFRTKSQLRRILDHDSLQWGQ